MNANPPARKVCLRPFLRSVSFGRHLATGLFSLGLFFAGSMFADDGKPNLAFYVPDGWAGALVATSNQNPAAPVTNLFPSDSVTLYWGVTNSGTATAESNWQYILYLDGAAILTNTYGSVLNVGGSAVMHYGLGRMSAGDHTLQVVLNETGEIVEQSNSDNSNSISVNVLSGGPNLRFYRPSGWLAAAVIAADPDPSGTTNLVFTPEQLYVDWAVQNAGTGPAPSNWYSTIYIDGAKLGSTLCAPVLNPFYYARLSMALPPLNPGTHVVTTVIDESNLVAELNEGDNVFTNTFTVIPGQPNLAFCQLPGWADSIVIAKAQGVTNNAPTHFLPSDEVFVTWAVTNNGTGFAASNWVATIYVDDAQVVTYPYPTIIMPGSYRWGSASIGQVGAGNHVIKIILDSGGALSETNTSDNIQTRNISVGAGAPNLTFAKPPGWSDALVVGPTAGVTNYASAVFTPANLITITYAVLNDGTGAVPAGWNATVKVDGVVRKVMPCDQTLAPHNYWAPSHQIGQLPAGTHVITVVLDSSSAVSETDETDNTRTVTITVAAGTPDLGFVQPVGWSDAVVISSSSGVTNSNQTVFSPADSIFVAMGVTNGGTGAAPANWYLAINVDGINQQNIKCDQSIQPLQTWAPIQAIGRLPEGTHTLEFLLDSTSVIREIFDTNNTFTKTITVVAGQPNLAFSQLPGWAAPVVLANAEGGTNILATNFLTTDDIYVSWAVTNNGTGVTPGDWQVSINVDGVSQGTYDNAALDPLAGRDVESYSLGKLSLGKHKIDVVLDSTSVVPETNETDNVYSTTVMVGQPSAPVLTLADSTQSPWLNWVTGGNAVWSVDYQTTHGASASARSGVIAAGESSWVETTVTGPGILTFWTKAAGDAGQLKFSINQADTHTFMGSYDWQLVRYEIPADTQVLRWTYSKPDGADTNGAAWLAQASFTSRLGITPIIVKQPDSQAVALGGNVSFGVDVSSGSGLTYQWLKNGARLANDKRIRGATGALLVITNAAMSDAANYAVAIYSPYGSATSAVATLTVTGVPPVIVNQPMSAIRTGGDRAVFDVVAAGTAPLSYRWFKDGVGLLNGGRVSGATNPVLTLTNVALDSGAYWVVVSNAYGSAESAHATLQARGADAQSPPVAITQPQDMVSTPGGWAFFAIDAAGLGLSYQWSRNGVKLAESGHLIGSKAAMLAISNVMTSDAGSYSVVVSNSKGFLVSSNATLGVAGQPPTNSTPLATISKHAGSTLTLYTTVNGTAPFRYFWRKEQTNLTAGGRIVGGVTNASLIVTNLQLSDAGTYSLLVSNAWGMVTNRMAVLTVLPNAPAITGNPRSATNMVGTTAVLTVTNAPASPISYAWYKDGRRLLPAGKIGGATTSRLTITNVFFPDAGVYVAVITNAAGMAVSAPAILTVVPEKVAPTITITAPAVVNSASWLVSVSGVARDNIGISNVWVRINGGAWKMAAGLNRGNSWSASLAPVAGANTIDAYAVDVCGNRSVNASARVSFVPCGYLTVRTAGAGIVTGVTNAQLLALGKPFTARAAATTGNHFTKWTTNLPGGSDVAAGASPSLTLAMSSNLTIKAWFAPNASQAAAKTYQGLFFDNTPERSDNVGFFSATVQDGGAFSACLKRSAVTSSFSGLLGTDGIWSTNVGGLGLSLQYDPTDGETIVGTVRGDGWSGQLRAVSLVSNSAIAGSYNVVLSPSGSGAVPQWLAMCGLTISTNGVASLSMSLNGPPLAISSFRGVSADGWWPVYQPLTASPGAVAGWLQFTNGTTGSNQISGALYLTK